MTITLPLWGWLLASLISTVCWILLSSVLLDAHYAWLVFCRKRLTYGLTPSYVLSGGGFLFVWPYFVGCEVWAVIRNVRQRGVSYAINQWLKSDAQVCIDSVDEKDWT